jgi:hypothetical protein
MMETRSVARIVLLGVKIMVWFGVDETTIVPEASELVVHVPCTFELR